MRRPLGIAIIGGLMVSQISRCTTPVVYCTSIGCSTGANALDGTRPTRAATG
jgi:hypothetical protein